MTIPEYADIRERVSELAAEIARIREAIDRNGWRRTKVHANIQCALTELGLSDQESLDVVLAISRGLVPHVRIEY